MRKIKTGIQTLLSLCLVITGMFLHNISAEAYNTPATTTADMAQYKGVTVSPTGEAWTTDYKDKTNERHPYGYTITTGVESSLKPLEKGQHYYNSIKAGAVNIGKWVVTHPDAQCIHDTMWGSNEYSGFPCRDYDCFRAYNNGWNAYCADCGELIEIGLIYAKEDTVKGILSMPEDSWYVYTCPYCDGLEQTRHLAHTCKKISYNTYTVKYEKNEPEGTTVSGSTRTTKHMYNNAEYYEDYPVSDIGYNNTKLRKNGYAVEGYEFKGWKLDPEGEKVDFTDEQEILNLCEDDKGVVTLYAHWEPSESTLHIDPAGGTYSGSNSLFSVKKTYLESYTIDMKKLVPPDGYTVTYEENGGTAVADEETEKVFHKWIKVLPFNGTFDEESFTYIFSAPNENEDTLKASYMDEAFVLPKTTKKAFAFGGWYYDEGLTEFAGNAGDMLTTGCDITLYAKWVELLLETTDNYIAYEGSGAVDCEWTQLDGLAKYYKLYQSKDKAEWKLVHNAELDESTLEIEKKYTSESDDNTYVVTSGGYYTLTAAGAKGADYDEEKTGGAGGKTTAVYRLEKGDILTFYTASETVGTEGGTNGNPDENSASGGSATTQTGRGGGAGTEIYLTRNGTTVPLLIAGGGGGASSKNPGMPGGMELTEIGDKAGKDSGNAGGGGGAVGGSFVAAEEEKPIEFKETHKMYLESGSYGGCGVEKLSDASYKIYLSTGSDDGGNANLYMKAHQEGNVRIPVGEDKNLVFATSYKGSGRCSVTVIGYKGETETQVYYKSGTAGKLSDTVSLEGYDYFSFTYQCYLTIDANQTKEATLTVTEFKFVSDEAQTAALTEENISKNAAYTRTTISNPAREDIAFKSRVTEKFADYKAMQLWATLQVSHKDNAGYPMHDMQLRDEEGNVTTSYWSRYFLNPDIIIGSLNRNLTIEETNKEGNEYHFGTTSLSLASESEVPNYYCYGTEGGFTRQFSATYPTNGNTNLVLSAAIDSWGGYVNGTIEFEVLDADTGEQLHNKKYVDIEVWDSGATPASVDIAAWDDIDVSGAENVTVIVRIHQVVERGAHTTAKVLDTFFYGKIIAAENVAEGGTSYICTDFGCKDQAYEGGTNNGSGYATIRSESVGYQVDTFLNNVVARDMAAPNRVVLTKDNITSNGNSSVVIRWDNPGDNGTTYYHKVESFDGVSDDVMLTSNITVNTLTSQVKGYYYYIDTKNTGVADKSHTYVSDDARKIVAEVNSTERYLHMAAVDKADNIGETTTILLKNQGEPDIEYPDKIYTEQIVLEETEYTYKKDEKTYYVNADGTKEHKLLMEGYLNKAALDMFQPDVLKLHMEKATGRKEAQWLGIIVPHGKINESERTFKDSELTETTGLEGVTYITSERAGAVRTENMTRLSVQQRFTMDREAPVINVYPEAVAYLKDKAYLSDNTEDRTHGLTLIPDGIPPIITGMDAFNTSGYINMTDEETSVTVYARDNESGLKNFSVTITNKDNHSSVTFIDGPGSSNDPVGKVYDSVKDGKITIKISKENPLFMGDFEIEAYAVDNVMNESISGNSGLAFTLEAALERTREPHDGVFKNGDEGAITVTTGGYATRYEIVFPEALTALNPDINYTETYETVEMTQTTVYKFNVPLGTPKGAYKIKVLAYKGERVLSETLLLPVEVSGSVTDEIRTTIRDNGEDVD